jgi:hypothetical protein
MMQIGVVGFSRDNFDRAEALRLLRASLDTLLARAGIEPAQAELVSGLTNVGIPRLAYEIASSLGMRTVGLSAREALAVGCGLFPVDETVLVGERFGDESEAFVARIDRLVRVGGGPQSRREAAMFREKIRRLGLDPDERMIEHEI